MKPRIIEEKGRKYAVIPYRMFERLQEDAEMLDDIQAYEDAKKSAGEHYPMELVERLVSRENPVKVFREYRGMTQAQLAKKVKIARAYLAQLEAGSREPSLRVLKSLACALRVELDEIA